MKKIHIYTDGSSLGNPGAGGYCGILEYERNGEKHTKTVCGGEAHTTNNRMELKAAIESIKVLKEPCEITLVTDSEYVAKAINEWIYGWVKKSFKGVKNVDLWEEYIAVSKGHKIKASWVRGHSGHPQNEECDKIAKSQAEIYQKNGK